MSLIEIAKQCYNIYGFYPISFSYCHPVEKTIPPKEKTLATIVPGDFSTYIFHDESTYYKDYQKSKFGLTKCKGGWDCMRHLEILANRCLPLFENIESCPRYTMIHHPKELYYEINQRKTELENDPHLYETYVRKLTDHFNNHLTGEKMAEYILQVTGNEQAQRVLFIDSKLASHFTDYLSMMIHNAFKMKFKQNCEVMYPGHNRFLYNDATLNRHSMYGKGFSYAGKVPAEYRTDYEQAGIYQENRILENIKNKFYDVIIYGAYFYSSDHLPFIQQYYPKDKILGFHGGDNYIYDEEIKQGVNNMTTFVREPGRIRVWTNPQKTTYTAYQEKMSLV